MREARLVSNSLLEVVMMRHTKSQRYLDGSPLVRIPSRSIEWRSVDLGDDRLPYQYMESFACEALTAVRRGRGEREGRREREEWSAAHHCRLFKN